MSKIVYGQHPADQEQQACSNPHASVSGGRLTRSRLYLLVLDGVERSSSDLFSQSCRRFIHATRHTRTGLAIFLTACSPSYS